MTKLITIFALFLSLNIVGIVHAKEQPPLMGNIKTIPSPEGNWVYIPEGNGEMIINVSTAYANTFKVWRVPTGTQQWENRTLICEKRGNEDDWTCTWRYTKDDNIHDHFVVEVSGEGGSATASINVTRKHAIDHPQ
ncbi:hypothetical protein [Paenibacillus sp. Soil522]|uniref:hypothetical protein n=1 Tax=Paenibacillus sp. Soil522 TaxID=1736388 RepID=UPI0006F69ECA|nr:hypothetical protein [Paenibacillus sp. Soil522]KRE22779.1 hypothetical protein ASG81_28915 [Paenibacillus sp. Soil522]